MQEDSRIRVHGDECNSQRELFSLGEIIIHTKTVSGLERRGNSQIRPTGEKSVSVCRSSGLAPSFHTGSYMHTLSFKISKLKLSQIRLSLLMHLTQIWYRSVDVAFVDNIVQHLGGSPGVFTQSELPATHGANCPLHTEQTVRCIRTFPAGIFRCFSIIHIPFQGRMVLHDLIPSAGIPRIMLLVQDLSYTGPAWIGWQIPDQLVLVISVYSKLSMPTSVGSWSPLIQAQVLTAGTCWGLQANVEGWGPVVNIYAYLGCPFCGWWMRIL